MDAQAMIAEFLAAGGKVTKLDPDACIGITGKQWGRLVRGTTEPVEVECLIAAREERERNRQPVRIRAGHGLVR